MQVNSAIYNGPRAAITVKAGRLLAVFYRALLQHPTHRALLAHERAIFWQPNQKRALVGRALAAAVRRTRRGGTRGVLNPGKAVVGGMVDRVMAFLPIRNGVLPAGASAQVCT